MLSSFTTAAASRILEYRLVCFLHLSAWMTGIDGVRVEASRESVHASAYAYAYAQVRFGAGCKQAQDAILLQMTGEEFRDDRVDERCRCHLQTGILRGNRNNTRVRLSC